MNLLIIGAGFIGSAVAQYAKSKVDNIDVWDLKQGQDIREAILPISGYDLVMIFAAITSQIEFQRHPKESFATNLGGLFNVLEASRMGGVKKVLFASSSAVYGNLGKRMSEEDRCDPKNFYATSKVMGEYLLKAYIQEGCFKGLVLRYFNTYGVGENSKGDYKSIISLFLQSIRERRQVLVYGDGTQRRDFINIKDVARITFELAMNHTGIFNVGTGHSISWNEILDVFEEENLNFQRNYIINPISGYQLFTEADIRKLRSLRLLPKIDIQQGIHELCA